MREFPAFDLVVANGGAKLTRAGEQSQTPPANPSSERKFDAQGFPQLDRAGLVTYNFFSHDVPMSRMVAKAQPMSVLASMLSTHTQAYVVDKTGLTGKYDFKMEFLFESGPTSSADGSLPPAPTIFSAIKTLGLSLEKSKASLDVVVVDHIDRALKSN